MLSQCIGLPQRSKLTAESRTISANQSSDGTESVDYSPAYELQENNAKLQNYYDTSLEEMIQIFSKFSTGMKKWRDRWQKKCAGQNSKITAFQDLWKIFATSVNSTTDYTEGIDDALEKLKKSQRLVLKREKDQSLKARIDEAGAEVEKLKQEIAELGNKLQRLNSKSPTSASSPSNSFGLMTRQESIPNRIAEKETIKSQKEKLLKKQTKIFRQKQADLFEETKTEEIELCGKLKQQSNAFVKALNIKTEDFAELFDKFNPAQSFETWEKTCFHQNNKQSNHSKTNENTKKKDKETTGVKDEE